MRLKALGEDAVEIDWSVMRLREVPKQGQTFADDWNDWLQCQILCREAEQVLRAAEQLSGNR